jgi:hypothetical protein
VSIIVVAVALLAQASAEDAQRQERLQFMKDRTAEFSIVRDPFKEPLSLRDEPIVRFNNPERESGTWDGATFLWLEGTRPVAAISYGIRRPNNAVFREHTSLSATPLVCRKGQADVWLPKSVGLSAQPFSEAPIPAETAASRLTQMRGLARRFAASCSRNGETTQLRLQPQPLYRFVDEKGGTLDGGLFSLVVSNDPEMFVLIEAVADKATGKSHWQYSLARMTSHQLTAKLDEKEIWSAPGYYSIPAAERRAGPYIEAYQGTFVSALPADDK